MEKIIDFLIKTSKRAYVPYSNFRVSCVLLFQDDKMVSGYNIENSAFTATCCAERVALFSAHNLNYNLKEIKEIYVYNQNVKFTSPCGVCRQVMSELVDLKTNVILVNGNRETMKFTVDELLPMSFGGSSLK